MTEVDRGSFTDSFTYDDNGNMTCRTESGVTYVQTYSAENRIASIQKLASGTCAEPGNLAAKWDFTYDGDGVCTGQSYTPYTDGVPGTLEITRYYFGGAYETRTDGTIKKYYSFAGQTVAMRTWNPELGTWNLSYFLSDHLGSTSVVLDDEGTILEQQRYLPFGQARELLNYATIQLTDFTYTGQRNLPDTGLMDYKARFYSPSLGRFVQPDTIIPGAANPQSWNRFSYVTNNPIGRIDPTGHRQVEDEFDYKGKTGCTNTKYCENGEPKDNSKDKPQKNIRFWGLRAWSVEELQTVYQAWWLLESDFGGSDNLSSALGGPVNFVHVPPGSLDGNVAETFDPLNIIFVDQDALNRQSHKEWFILHEIAHIFSMNNSNGDPGLYKSNTFVNVFVPGGCNLNWHGCTGSEWNPTDRDTTSYGLSDGSEEDFADSLASTVLYNHSLESSSYKNVSQNRMNIINLWISIYAAPQ